jgi:urea carboxylase
MQVRVYAEDPFKDFQPGAGTLTHVHWPRSARVETWVESGSEVTPYYDPMLAKIIVHGNDRADALAKLRAALSECEVAGIETNVEYLRQVCSDPVFAAGGVTTSFLKDFDYRRNAIDVIEPGTQTTIQDYPGREGYWHVGVPPSGPMDSLAFRLANRLVGNSEGTAGLEIAVTGPSLRFRSDAVIALTGADFGARLDGVPIKPWRSVAVKPGSLLEIGSAEGNGARAYLSVAGGFDVPEYLGSRSTFILGKFGGHAGRSLRAEDVLAIAEPSAPEIRELHPHLIPDYSKDWEIGAMYGPHGAPDFFTPEDIDVFFSTRWKVHYNSDRTGVRLIGPKPVWARKDGGEAGLHPSNIHDTAYAIGTVDFTGDMPVILGPDGPSLGGFVCPATIVNAELWKIGQLRPGDTVRFHGVTLAQALEMESRNDRVIAALSGSLAKLPETPVREEPVLRRNDRVACRADGDRYLLVEYGPMALDLNLRIRVHALETTLRAAQLPGIVDITEGVRSLQIHYDARRLRREDLLAALDSCERRIPDLDDIVVPSRIVHLPLSWDDPATRLAIQKYMQSVRPDAPWCPSNIEFIRRINGLESIEDVRRIVFAASYLVLGLGDVYLGAPVAAPVDPRHRLVTTKYNPARTWTPENAVGIGGAYMCVYGMEGPGGYQFVGRTVQMWNTYAKGESPYLLRTFDQIRFHTVSPQELLELREARPALRIEQREFRLKDYHAFVASIQEDAAQWKRRQQHAFLEERERWGEDRSMESPDLAEAPPVDEPVPEGCRAVTAPVAASVWNIACEPGQRIQAGQKLIVLEAMKMEIAVTAPVSGVLEKLHCSLGALVSAGQRLATIRKENPS